MVALVPGFAQSCEAPEGGESCGPSGASGSITTRRTTRVGRYCSGDFSAGGAGVTGGSGVVEGAGAPGAADVGAAPCCG